MVSTVSEVDVVEAMLAFLPYCADRRNTFYEINTARSMIDPYCYSEEIREFEQLLHDPRILLRHVVWVDWQATARCYFDHSGRLERARFTTLQKLLTTHVRKERFCRGHLAAMIDSGHLLAILQRLNALDRRPE